MLIFDNKIILYSLFVFTGSALGIIAKILQSLKGLDQYFKHPFMYSLTLFLSETTGILTYNYYFKKEDETDKTSIEENIIKKPLELYLLAIPAVFDLFSSSFGMLSYENLPASITTMFDGGNTIGVFLLSIFFLKNKHSKYNFIGVFLLIIGLFLISLSAINDDNKQDEATGLKETIYGILCCICCNIFTALHAITEEYLFKTRVIHPIKLIGFEGVFGSIFSFILILIFSQIKFGSYFSFICIKYDNEFYLENLGLALKQMWNNKKIIIVIFFQFFIFIFYNYAYITITKVANATTNVVLYNMTALFIWIFFLLPIHEKKIQERIGILQVLGFLILILGVCVYNEIFIKKEIDDIGEIKNLIPDDSSITDEPLVI